MLIAEQRENQARKAQFCGAAAEKRAVEQDQRFRASLGVGVPAAALQGFETYGQAVAAATLDAQQYSPKASVIADLLDNDGSTITFHLIHNEPEDAA